MPIIPTIPTIPTRRKWLIAALASTAMPRLFAQAPQTRSEEKFSAILPDPTEHIMLWPHGAPGLAERDQRAGRPLVETINERSTSQSFKDRAVLGISRPRLVVFRPNVANAANGANSTNGASILLMPGGGYKWVVMDKEGFELGHWLSARGYTVFVLFYRLPGDGWPDRANVALADAQRAMRLIRHRAAAEGLDPRRVGAMGFSAGGHVCADLMTRFAQPVYAPVDAADTQSARPIIAAPIYPVISMSAPHAHAGSREQLLGPNATPALEQAHSPHLNVPDNASPCFLLHAEDDTAVPVENTLLLRAALKSRRVPVETHIFAAGGHGFGMRLVQGKPAEAWPELFVAWARGQGL